MTAPGVNSGWPEYSPGEQLAHQFGYRTPTDDLIALIGGLVILGGVGVVAVGVTVFDALTSKKREPAVPATTSQKIARVGLVGSLIGAGAYAYLSGQRPATPSSVPPTLSPHKMPTGQVRGSFPGWGHR